MEDYVKRQISKAGDGASVAETPEEFEEDGGLTPQDLQAVLPDDVWRVVRRYLAQDGAHLPDADEADSVEKSVTDALTTSGDTLTKVRSEMAAHQEASTSYEGTLEKGEPISKTLLTNFYDSVETPKPIRKREGKETSNPALRQVDEADL